jgi:hypothetical protein
MDYTRGSTKRSFREIRSSRVNALEKNTSTFVEDIDVFAGLIADNQPDFLRGNKSLFAVSHERTPFDLLAETIDIDRAHEKRSADFLRTNVDAAHLHSESSSDLARKKLKKRSGIEKRSEEEEAYFAHPEVAAMVQAARGRGQTTEKKKRWGRSLEKQIKETTRQLTDMDERWVLDKGWKPDIMQIGSNRWRVTLHENNWLRQHHRITIATVERKSNGQYECLSKEPFAMDLAIAELCSEKLQSFRLKYAMKYMMTEASYVEEYHQELEKLGDQPTEQQRKDLSKKYVKKLKEAREKYEKDIKSLDDIYKHQRLDSMTLADLEQKEAKEANEMDLDRRIKSVESKMSKNPEELRKNTQSLQKSLDKMAALMQEIGPQIDTSLGGRTDQRTGSAILASLKESLATGKAADALSSLEELNVRFQHYELSAHSEHNGDHQDKMAELHKVRADIYLQFTKREILLEEQQILPIKDERYIRSQDAEAMFYTNQLIKHQEKVADARARLAVAQTDFVESKEEAERIFQGFRVYQRARPTHSTENTVAPSAPEQTTDPSDPHLSPAFRNAQLRVERANARLLALTQEVAELEDQGKKLQWQFDTANGRYNTNETRETLKRDAIHEYNKMTIENKRKIYEKHVDIQVREIEMNLRLLLLKFHMRNLLILQALEAAMQTPLSTMQREMTNQWNAAQSLFTGR